MLDGVETESGDVWEAEYVVGADGAGSTVRKEIGAVFHGTESENSFIIADIEADPDHPRTKERVLHYDHRGPTAERPARAVPGRVARRHPVQGRTRS